MAAFSADLHVTPEDVERELKMLFTKHNVAGNVTVDMVKDLVYNEKGGDYATQKFQQKMIDLLHITSESEFIEAMPVFIEAWNNFPHKSLKSKSPAELFREDRKKREPLNLAISTRAIKLSEELTLDECQKIGGRYSAGGCVAESVDFEKLAEIKDFDLSRIEETVELLTRQLPQTTSITYGSGKLWHEWHEWRKTVK